MDADGVRGVDIRDVHTGNSRGLSSADAIRIDNPPDPRPLAGDVFPTATKACPVPGAAVGTNSQQCLSRRSEQP